MRNTILGCMVIILSLYLKSAKAQTEPFIKRTVTSGLNSAWEVVYGPNDSLWVTENTTDKVAWRCKLKKLSNNKFLM